MSAPFLDGSTVLTNICTDMELHSNQQTVNAVFQSPESDMLPHCCIILCAFGKINWT